MAAALLAPGPTAFAVTPTVPRFEFSVFRPDGTPATDAVARAYVIGSLDDGPQMMYEHRFRADSLGVLHVAIPQADPYISTHFPSQRVFNVHVIINTTNPGERSPATFGAVDFVLNLGDPRMSLDPAHANNAVVDLVPTPSRGLDPGDGYPDAADCPGHDQFDGPFWNCAVVSHPSSMQGAPMTVAHNVGAATDMRTEFHVGNSQQVGSSMAAGTDGFFVEAQGAAAVVQKLSHGLGWISNSPPDFSNNDAVALMRIAEFDIYTCDDWEGKCHQTTWTEPEAMVGEDSQLRPTSEVVYHDQAKDPGPTDTDCTTGVQYEMTDARGTNTRESWTFGFDFKGQAEVVELHAYAVVAGFEAEELTNYYRWAVNQPNSTWQFRHHHVFVHLGALEDSGATAICPYDSPGSSWTDASNTYKVNLKTATGPVEDNLEPVPTPQQANEAADEGKDKVDRCTEAPERCGRE